MKELNTILENINKAVEDYEVCKLSFTHDQSEILQRLSTNLHWLAEHRIDYNKKWMYAYFTSKEKSAAGKERQADYEVPEMYKIRHLMASGYKVLESIRSTISANKKQDS